MVGELLGSLDVNAGGLLNLKLPDLSRLVDLARSADMAALRRMGDELKEGGLIGLALSPERRTLLDRAQAFMALLEGYAEHVMDAVGAELLTDLASMREALERRRHERTGFLRLFERLIGMDLKLRQYEQGKAFCDAVVGYGGIAALNRVWAAPESMPSPAELD